MVISGIHLHNFKSFKDGRIEGLAQNLDDKKNVILVGGLNGAGKTTFLESLYLCLYGKGADKMYPSRGARHENYFGLIGSLLNNDVKQSGQNWASMCVEVFMNNVPLTSNVLKNISLKRTWEFPLINGGLAGESKEIFEILEDGKLVEELDPAEYQHYVDTLLPYDVSQLFLFDGEKIQDFAGDPDVEFSVALKKVLGISLYAQLSEDLKTTRSHILTEYNRNKQSEEQRTKMIIELNTKDDDIQNNRLEIIAINDKLDNLQIAREKIQNETSRVTRIRATDRNDFERQKAELELERQNLEAAYINEATDYLPFLLPDSLCAEVLQQIANEDLNSHFQCI
jgi:DNA sulfur modification protein DndD